MKIETVCIVHYVHTCGVTTCTAAAYTVYRRAFLNLWLHSTVPTLHGIHANQFWLKNCAHTLRKWSKVAVFTNMKQLMWYVLAEFMFLTSRNIYIRAKTMMIKVATWSLPTQGQWHSQLIDSPGQLPGKQDDVVLIKAIALKIQIKGNISVM